MLHWLTDTETVTRQATMRTSQQSPIFEQRLEDTAFLQQNPPGVMVIGNSGCPDWTGSDEKRSIRASRAPERDYFW